MYNRYTDLQVIREAEEVLKEGASIVTAAALLGMPQTTLWWHINHRLRRLDPSLYLRVREKMERSFKGGGRGNHGNWKPRPWKPQE